jgi:hypothetical protein
VVVNNGGKPVRGLKKEDFNLFEDGNAQTIAFFEPMMQYLKTLPPDRRVAVFTLGSHLRLLEGFGSDAAPLLAVLNSKQSNPQATMRAQKDDAFKDREVLDMLASGGATQEMLDAYKDFMATSKAFQRDMRVDLTPEGLVLR